MSNPYLPQKAEIVEIIQETASSDLDIKTYKLKLLEGAPMEFMPGQFIELSIAGVGEAPFGFASSPLDKEFIELSIKRVGLVTEVIHNLNPGDVVGIRGPFGNTFPVEKLEGSNIVILAGGLGLAPLRPLILYMLDQTNRDKYKKIQMLLAARTPGDFIYTREYDQWRDIKDTEVLQTIDNPVDGWDGKVGFPHNMVPDMGIDVENTYAITCGPPIMIKFISKALMDLGIPKDKILTTLENRMTCGVGKCGKCNIGHQYVCVDGPVFTMDDLSKMPNEY